MLWHIVFLHQVWQGDIHTLKLSNSLYVPGLPQTLLCIQHWAEVDQDQGTSAINTWSGCILVWNKGRRSKCIPLNTKTNTPTFMTAPDTFAHCVFEAAFVSFDALSPHLNNPVINATLIWGRMLHRNSEIFIAKRTSTLRTKSCWKKKTLIVMLRWCKSASSATLVWPMMILALSIQQSTTSGRNADITLTINWSSKAHSPSHPYSIEQKQLKTMKFRFCWHLMTKLSSCGDITDWGTSFSLCWKHLQKWQDPVIPKCKGTQIHLLPIWKNY